MIKSLQDRVSTIKCRVSDIRYKVWGMRYWVSGRRKRKGGFLPDIGGLCKACDSVNIRRIVEINRKVAQS